MSFSWEEPLTDDEEENIKEFWTLPQAVYKVKQLYLNNIH